MNPSLHKAFHVGYTPSDEEASDIKQILAPHFLSLETTRKELQVLIDRFKHYEKLVETYSAVVAPARRLPTEILSLIFLCQCYFDQCRWRSSYRGARYPTILLTHVYQRWREVAFATPLLWSTIRVRFPKYSTASLPDPGQAVNVNKVWHQLAVETWSLKMRREEELLTKCLERSDCAPLQLTVAATEDQASSFSDLPDHSIWEEMRQRVVSANAMPPNAGNEPLSP